MTQEDETGHLRPVLATRYTPDEAYSEDRDGEVLFDGMLHEDSYELLVDEHEKEISRRMSR